MPRTDSSVDIQGTGFGNHVPAGGSGGRRQGRQARICAGGRSLSGARQDAASHGSQSRAAGFAGIAPRLRLKAAEKIGAAAARVLARNHGHRYYDWAYEDGVFRFFEHSVHFTREQAYEGKYVIQTEEPNLSAVDAVRLYKELSEVERAFADLKDVLELRPIYHQIDSRVRAHIYVAALAFLLHRAIEKKLKAARLDLSATEALTALMYLLTTSRYPAIARVVHLVVISLILRV